MASIQNDYHEILLQPENGIIGNDNHEILPQLEDGIMASIQNGNNDSPQESDEDIMVSIQNGNHESPPQLDDSVVKVVVIGEPKCGKTKFIRAYYDYHFPGGIYSHNGVKVYPCELESFNQYRRVSIFEIPSDPDFFLEQRIPHYEDADIIIFMYAIDDPTSLQMLCEKWILEAIDIIEFYKLPVLFVGNKKDLQDDQQVIERLALQNRSPVTYQQGKEMLDKFSSNVTIMECSANDLSMVQLIFSTIFTIVQMTEQ